MVDEVKFSEKHEIQFYECDGTGRLMLPMLLNIVIKTSEAQSLALGRGTDYVNSLGYGWVITEHDLKINRLPKTGEIVTVTTQAQEHNKYFCYRYFWLHDEAGNELVEIQSTFVVMDFNTRKMVSVPEDLIAPYGSQKIKSIKRGEKIEELDSYDERSYRVRFSDIDTNHHVNNSKYFDWMTDCLPIDYLLSYAPKQVLIRFAKEVNYGEQVSSRWAHPKVEGKLVEDETIHNVFVGDNKCAEALIKWENELTE